MTSASHPSSRISAEFPVPGVKLTQFQARVWEWIRKRGHIPHGICQAAKTLAEAFGCTRRYVEKALKLFVDLGVLRHVRDYGLTTRRRYFVVGSPADPGPDAPLFSEPEFAESASPSSHTNVPPLDPPMEVSGEREGEKGGGGAVELDATAPPEAMAGPAPPPPETFRAPIEDGDEEKARKQAYLDATVADAEKLFGPGRRAWVVASAKELGRGLMALRAAIRRGLEKVAEGGKVSTGYVIRTADSMRAAGGPPPELAHPEQAAADQAAKLEENARKLEETFKLMDALGWK